MRKAKKLFETFHQFSHRELVASPAVIPKQAHCVGIAQTMYYTSDKLNPLSGEDEGHQSYYHDHGKKVTLCLTDADEGYLRKIPKWIHESKSLVLLGECDGFDYENLDGELIEARMNDQYTDWYAVPSGKALLAIYKEREILAILWGGDLHIEWRGVVG